MALSTLLTLLSLLLHSFVDASSMLRVYSKVFVVRVSLCQGGMLFLVIGVLYVVMVRVVLSLPLIHGIGGFLLICTVSRGGVLIPWSWGLLGMGWSKGGFGSLSLLLECLLDLCSTSALLSWLAF